MSSIKMDRRLMERLALVVASNVQHGMDSPYSVIRDAYESNNRLRARAGDLFPELQRSGFQPLRDLQWEDILLECTDVLEGGGGTDSTEHFPKLIATIVDLLQAPHGREVLAGDTLRRLRKAVLFPEEMAKVTANAIKELHCVSCGHPFADGEMSTFMDGGFLCTRCTIPTSAACSKLSNCDGVGELDHRQLQKQVNKVVCNEHNGKAPVEPIPPDIRAQVGQALGQRFGAAQVADPHVVVHPFGDAPEPAPPNQPQWIEVGEQARARVMPEDQPAPGGPFLNARRRANR